MRIYHYQEDTGEYLGWSNGATPCPIENPEGKKSGVWIIPAHATTIKPPALFKGNVLVFRKGAWGYLLPDDINGTPAPEPVVIITKEEEAEEEPTDEMVGIT